jgi:hypothetical protein
MAAAPTRACRTQKVRKAARLLTEIYFFALRAIFSLVADSHISADHSAPKHEDPDIDVIPTILVSIGMGNGQSFTENEGDGAYEPHPSRSSRLLRQYSNEHVSDDDVASYDVVSFAEDGHTLTMKRNDNEIENRTKIHDKKEISSGSSANPSSSSPTTSYTRYSQTNSVVTFEDDDFSSSIDDTSFSKSHYVLYDTDEVTALTDMAHDGDDERTKHTRQSRRSEWSTHLRERGDHCASQEIDDQNNGADTEEETIMILDAEEEFSRRSGNILVWQQSPEAIPTVSATDVTFVAGTVETCNKDQLTEESFTDKENINDDDDDVNVKILVHGMQGVPVEPNPNHESCAQSTHSSKDKKSSISSQKVLRINQCTEGESSMIVANQQKGKDPVGEVFSGLNAEPNRNRNTAVPVLASGLDTYSELNRNHRQLSLNRNPEGGTSVFAFGLDADAEPNINGTIAGLSSQTTRSSNQNAKSEHSEKASGLDTDVEPHRNLDVVAHFSDMQLFLSRKPKVKPSLVPDDLDGDVELDRNINVTIHSSDTQDSFNQNSNRERSEVPPTKESTKLELTICMARPDVESSRPNKIILQGPLHVPALNEGSKNRQIETPEADVASHFKQVSGSVLPTGNALKETEDGTKALSTIVANEVKELEVQVKNAFALSDEIELANINVFLDEQRNSVDHLDKAVVDPNCQSDVSSHLDEEIVVDALDINASGVLADVVFESELRLNAIPSAASCSKKMPTSPKPEDIRDRNVAPKKDCSDDMILALSPSNGNVEDIDLLLVREYDEVFNTLMELHPELMMDHPAAMEIIRIAKLQKILSVTVEAESELREYVQTLNEQKLEMTSHYHSKLLEASKKKAAREIYLQEELRKKKDILFDCERRSTWDTMHYFRQLCVMYNHTQHYLLQQMADTNDPLDILPESLAGNKKLLLDALLCTVDPEHSDGTGFSGLQYENTLLSQQATILEQELASLQQKTMKNENEVSWVSPFLCSLDANQFESLRQRFDEQTAKSTTGK